MNKSLLLKTMIVGFVVSGFLAPLVISAHKEKQIVAPISAPVKVYSVIKTTKMILTAYTSDPLETDDRPREAASGKEVFDGMVANNGLKFGTKVRIPKLFGDKIFVVEDRMHSRKGTRMMDIWMEKKSDAKQFGAKYNVTIEVVKEVLEI